MVPRHHRLQRSTQFQAAVRHGVRAARRHVVVHLAHSSDVHHALVGFVVSKAVGNAVIRHKVSRQLRHVMAQRLHSLPTDTLLVVRANPTAATASFAELSADIDAGLAKVLA